MAEYHGKTKIKRDKNGNVLCPGIPSKYINAHPTILDRMYTNGHSKCKDCEIIRNISKNRGEYKKKYNDKKFGEDADPYIKAQHALVAIEYRLAKEKRTPPWTTKEMHKEILEIYTECKRLTRDTGIKYQVDHIEPLRGDHVSGLHVPWNLQILTAEENRRKSNK